VKIDRDDWRDDAACAEVGGDSWYPEKGESNAEAKRICFRCAVIDECLDEALANAKTFGGHGVWGGVTEDERRNMIRARRKAAA
jgi:WhiB family transcriptional regulator, redox-sensing transcriptional regulator